MFMGLKGKPDALSIRYEIRSVHPSLESGHGEALSSAAGTAEDLRLQFRSHRCSECGQKGLLHAEGAR